MIIPFFIPHSGCPHQCVFCNQKNITGQSAPIEPADIADKLSDYLSPYAGSLPAQVAFYGGTFTALSLDTQKAYLQAVWNHALSSKIESIRISTRPDCIDPLILSVLKQFKVTIVELGAQSMDDEVLKLSGRGHSSADTVRSVHLLREQGFKTGLQLMAGLPGDTPEIFLRSIEAAIHLKPDCVRIYPVVVIKDTPLAHLYAKGLYTPLSLDAAVSQCCNALQLFEHAGIPVIRIGLQSSLELSQPDTIIAGPYHPAFRQLVESSLYLSKMRTLLRNRPLQETAALFLVNSRDMSAAIGQHRSNILALKKEFGLHTLKIVGVEGILRSYSPILQSE